MITTLEATPENQKRMAAKERMKGRKAYLRGEPRSACPWDPTSMVAGWWLEGYDERPMSLVNERRLKT